MTKEVIIVGADHHNTLNVVRAFGVEGYFISLLVVSDTDKVFVRHSKYVNEFYVFSNEEEVVNHLLIHKRNVKVPIITASDKAADTLDRYYDQLSHYYVLANCDGVQGGIFKWMNKKIMSQKAKECGLRIPFSSFMDGSNDNDCSNISYPCLIKPAKSCNASKDDFCVCNNFDELVKTLTILKSRNVDCLIQEYLNVDYEYLIVGSRCRNTGNNHIVGGLYKLKCSTDTNNMGMFLAGYTSSIIHNDINIDSLNRFLDAIDYEGIYSVEFVVSGEMAYFTEINLRTDACLFCWTNSGCNIAVNWVDEMLSGEGPTYPLLEEKKMLVEIGYVKYGYKHPITLLKDFFQADAFAIFDKHDIKPFFYKFKYFFGI